MASVIAILTIAIATSLIHFPSAETVFAFTGSGSGEDPASVSLKLVRNSALMGEPIAAEISAGSAIPNNSIAEVQASINGDRWVTIGSTHLSQGTGKVTILPPYGNLKIATIIKFANSKYSSNILNIDIRDKTNEVFRLAKLGESFSILGFISPDAQEEIIFAKQAYFDGSIDRDILHSSLALKDEQEFRNATFPVIGAILTALPFISLIPIWLHRTLRQVRKVIPIPGNEKAGPQTSRLLQFTAASDVHRSEKDSDLESRTDKQSIPTKSDFRTRTVKSIQTRRYILFSAILFVGALTATATYHTITFQMTKIAYSLAIVGLIFWVFCITASAIIKHARYFLILLLCLAVAALALVLYDVAPRESKASLLLLPTFGISPFDSPQEVLMDWPKKMENTPVLSTTLFSFVEWMATSADSQYHQGTVLFSQLQSINECSGPSLTVTKPVFGSCLQEIRLSDNFIVSIDELGIGLISVGIIGIVFGTLRRLTTFSFNGDNIIITRQSAVFGKRTLQIGQSSIKSISCMIKQNGSCDLAIHLADGLKYKDSIFEKLLGSAVDQVKNQIEEPVLYFKPYRQSRKRKEEIFRKDFLRRAEEGLPEAEKPYSDMTKEEIKELRKKVAWYEFRAGGILLVSNLANPEEIIATLTNNSINVRTLKFYKTGFVGPITA